MHNFSRLIILVLLLTSSLAHAAFKPLKPPPGYSSGSFNTARGGSPAAGGVASQGELVVAGSAAQVPVLTPWASNAAAVGASLLFKNPSLFTALTVGQWLAGECLSVEGGVWKLTCGAETGELSDGKIYKTQGEGSTASATRQGSCNAYVAIYLANSTPRTVTTVSAETSYPLTTGCRIGYTLTEACCGGVPAGTTGTYIATMSATVNPSCPAGKYLSPTGACTDAPVPWTIDEAPFVERVADDTPIPVGLPWAVPGDWPVSTPIINGGNPMQFPTGSPVPDPGSSPQTYTQPIVTVKPANTAADPWRVDVQPGTITVTTPGGLTAPTTTPTATATATASAGSGDTPDFCLLHPESIVCKGMGTLEAIDIPHENKPVAITPDSGWGPSTAACPAPRVITVQGKTLTFSLKFICDFADMIRPVVIGVAWITAVFSFIGFGRKEST